MRKILLIEDNPEVRENTAEILELSNYIVATAENGKVGVELAKEIKPDLIICDIMMPELDGYGVLFALSKNPTTAHIPFIFLTAKADKSDFRKGMNMGADDYLTKPFDDIELLNAIESRMRKNEALKAEYARDAEGFDAFVRDAEKTANLETLSKDRKRKNYKKKEIIYREGDYPNTLYLITSGKVKTFLINDDGKEYITGLYKEGDFFGYMAILQNAEHSECASVLEDCELCIIPRNDFQTLLEVNRSVAQKFIQMLSANINEKEQLLLDLAYNTVRKRVADALIALEDKYKKTDTEHFSISISRDDLASMVGTATESVIRTLSEFKEDGYIEIKSSTITITNSKKIREMRY